MGLSVMLDDLGLGCYPAQSSLTQNKRVTNSVFLRAKTSCSLQRTNSTNRNRGKKMPTLTKLYSMEEASQHNTSEDCWVVIDGKVYDVTEYLDEHPGGDDVLLRATGKDATDEFEDAGHGRTARELMKQFFIGELDVPIPDIPELEIVSKNDKEPDDIPHKVLAVSKEYWFLPLALAGLSIAIRVWVQTKK